MAVNLAQEANLLRPGLRGVEGLYQQIPTQWTKFLDKGTSNMAIERTAEQRFLGLAAVKQEGTAANFDNAAGDRFVWNQRHQTIALGYAFTREAIEDNLYKSLFDPTMLNMADVFKQTKEIIAANLLNTGTTYVAETGGDGVALFSTAHPIDSGVTWANRPTTDVDLNETALQNAAISIRYFPDIANLRVFARPDCLLIPPQLEYVALRLMKSELRPGTTDNDINALIASGYFKKGYEVLDFLTSQFAWFVKSDKKGWLYLDRRKFETDMQVDFTTQNLLVLGSERYSVGAFNPRAGYGSFPTA